MNSSFASGWRKKFFQRRLLSKLTVAAPLMVALAGSEYLRWLGTDAAEALIPSAALCLLPGVALAATIGLAWRAARRLTASATTLMTAVTTASRGGDVGLDLKAVGELGHLAEAFHLLADTLRESQRTSVEASENFRRIFETLPVPASLYAGAEQGLVHVNDAFCRYYGRTRKELLGHTLAEFQLGPEAVERPAVKAALSGTAGVYNYETSVRTPAGELRQVLTSAEVIDYNGRPHVLSIQVDVTDRVLAVEELRERQQQLTGIVGSTPDGIVTVDASGKIVVFNESACRIFGVAAQDVLGRTPERFLAPELRPAFKVEFDMAREQHAPLAARRITQRIDGLRADGTPVPLEVSVSGAGEGDRRTFTAVLRDASEQEAMEAARNASERAIAANQAKNQFLSRMSHELRTPLNAVVGFSQLLKESTRSQLNADQSRQLTLIARAGRQLTELIDDILDLSRIESGALTVQLQAVQLDTTVNDVIQLSESESRAQRLRITVDVSSETVVRADPLRLQQVLQNVLSNAIKYNRPNGEIHVSARQVEAGVEVRVSDTGVGMTPAQLSNMYEPFNRLGREHTSIPGTGIGLALCKQLMQLMGGDIAIASQDGAGSCVTLRLPLAQEVPPPEVRLNEQEEQDIPPSVVLYIEDIALNVMLVRMLLAKWPQIELHVAEDGATGLALARSKRPNLILLDMHLPDMPGVQVLARLQNEADTVSIPVVALSADAMSEDVNHARAAGASEYWTKPIDFESFRQGIVRWLRRPR